MPKPNQMSLAQLKANMQTEAEKRQALIEQGSRAFRLGITKGNCPLSELSARQLWNEGWDKAKKALDGLFPERRGYVEYLANK